MLAGEVASPPSPPARSTLEGLSWAGWKPTWRRTALVLEESLRGARPSARPSRSSRGRSILLRCPEMLQSEIEALKVAATGEEPGVVAGCRPLQMSGPMHSSEPV